MHAEISESEPLLTASEVERAVIGELLDGEHGVWTRAELERAVAGVRGSRIFVDDAISGLYRMGLVHVFGSSGEFVTPTRAARQMDQLTL